MDGQTAGRPDGRLRRFVVSATMFLLAVGPSGRPAVGQVGHDPANSPYRDVTLKPTLSPYFGYLMADRGRARVGVSNALTFGVRYELPTGRSLLFQFGTAYLRGDRFVADPRADSTSPQRLTGPFNAAVLLADIGVQLRLTGTKSWHGMAPYAGVGLGMLFDADSPTDSSGYKFGTKLTLSGTTGMRLYPSRRITINAEARAQLWRLKYPLSFHDTNQAPDHSTVVPLRDPLNDWTLHPWFSLGIGWTF